MGQTLSEPVVEKVRVRVVVLFSVIFGIALDWSAFDGIPASVIMSAPRNVLLKPS